MFCAANMADLYQCNVLVLLELRCARLLFRPYLFFSTLICLLTRIRQFSVHVVPPSTVALASLTVFRTRSTIILFLRSCFLLDCRALSP